jgi:hypothetical protein
LLFLPSPFPGKGRKEQDRVSEKVCMEVFQTVEEGETGPKSDNRGD